MTQRDNSHKSNLRQGRIAYAIETQYWRPTAYGVERGGDNYYAAVIFKTESGQERRLVDGRAYDDENRAADAAEALLQYAQMRAARREDSIELGD